MLRIYNVIREFLRSLKPLLERIEKRDPDLGRQLRRASASVLLNVGEGSGNKGRLRTLRYSTAQGSMHESVACLDVAEVSATSMASTP
jgi:four helix bundle protein